MFNSIHRFLVPNKWDTFKIAKYPESRCVFRFLPKTRKSPGGIFSFVIDYANCFKGAPNAAIVKKYESAYKNLCSCRPPHMRIVAYCVDAGYKVVSVSKGVLFGIFLSCGQYGHRGTLGSGTFGRVRSSSCLVAVGRVHTTADAHAHTYYKKQRTITETELFCC